MLADHWDHVQHVLDHQYGDLVSTAVPEEQECQQAIAEAGQRFLLETHQAIADCLTSHQSHGGRKGLARDCIGEVTPKGHVLAPQDQPTKKDLQQAEKRLRQRLAAACAYEQLALLDACGSDQPSLRQCLLCSHRREAMLLIGGEFGGTPEQPSSDFIQWEALHNPILQRGDRMLKDQAVAYAEKEGTFYLFSSTRFELTDPDQDTKAPVFFKTTDFLTYEEFIVPGLNTRDDAGVGSPDLTRIHQQWHMVFQRRAAENPAQAQLWHTTSWNLRDWTVPQLFVDPEAVLRDLLPPPPAEPPCISSELEPPDPLSLIDGALAYEPRARKEGAYVLGFKWRCQQTFHVTRSTSLAPVADPDNPAASPTPPWRQAVRALAGPDDPTLGFAENYQFLQIDNVWRLIATARDPEVTIGPSGVEGRCGNPFGPAGVFYIYQCSHEPFLYTIAGAGRPWRDWTRWRRKTRLRIPYEDWNTLMHANAAFLTDWRAYDGFFYLFYAGAAPDQTDPTGLGFAFRGHGKIGVARSRDLIHWRLPGDRRD